VNARLLALGLAFVTCAMPVQAQTPQKMPVPVEDDPSAPAAMHAPPATTTAPSTTPQNPPPPEALAPSGPYSQAMVRYKAGDYDQAWDLIKGIDPAKQDDNFVILGAKILTELKRYDDGEKILRQRIGAGTGTDEALPPDANKNELIVTLGDLFLHKRSYDRAAKYYAAALKAKPSDPDLTLKLIYARIGTGDLRAADQLASQLSPFDPKNPYDDHASYYFARAALAQATGKSADADDEIQNARTNYGITVTNRYLKTYLQFFSAPVKGSPADLAPSPAPAKP
jgi:tetratricopeptide (TPR) repeat protein